MTYYELIKKIAYSNYPTTFKSNANPDELQCELNRLHQYRDFNLNVRVKEMKNKGFHLRVQQLNSGMIRAGWAKNEPTFFIDWDNAPIEVVLEYMVEYRERELEVCQNFVNRLQKEEKS